MCRVSPLNRGFAAQVVDSEFIEVEGLTLVNPTGDILVFFPLFEYFLSV
jgi:hypothetical protein